MEERGVCELFICCIYGSWGWEHGKTGSGINTLNSNEMLRLDTETGLSRMEESQEDSHHLGLL